MNKARIAIYFCLLLILVIGYLPLARPELVGASPGKLIWSIANTPSDVGKVIVSPSEINALVVGVDGKTFYTIDVPNKKVYKSTDQGVTWTDALADRLTAAGAALPAWDIAIAPDDPKIVAVVTNNRTQVYLSTDGGNRWVNTNVPPAVVIGGLLIADIAISPPYTLAGRKTYDIAIGTRLPDGAANGDVWVMQLGIGVWRTQGIPIRDVSTVYFSPNYVTDRTILAIASDGTGTYLCLGRRDTDANTTTWNVPFGYPVRIPLIGASPFENQIITSGLALPSDYRGDKPEKRRVYVYYDSEVAVANDVYRLDDIIVFRLRVDIARLASIAYTGTYEKGRLLVGGRLAEATLARAIIRYTTNPETASPDWRTPDKLPTGGGGSGYANAQVVWSPDGAEAYCGTGTAYIAGAADWADVDPMPFPLLWPWRGDRWDESAFSITRDGGKTWNQLSLIDTELSQLGNVAVSAESKTLYLASINTKAGLDGFDSVWRSTSDPLGEVWERVWCGITNTNELLLRTNEKVESALLILAERAIIAPVGKVYSSLDKGQRWAGVVSGIMVTDLTVDSDEVFYILEDIFVRKVRRHGGAWIVEMKFSTGLFTGHTIITPLRDPEGTDYVIVGDGGEGKVAYSSDGGRVFYRTEAVPVPGKIHVATDEKFEVNKIIYAASDSITGKIYRWTIDKSLFWEELLPPNSGFYGLVQLKDVLYGAWFDGLKGGVDRILYPRIILPSPREWDSLIAGLPAGVRFTREPSSLKVSTKDEHLLLWAIDDRPYNWAAKQGCLWSYTDTLVKTGPWAVAPAPGELLPFDPVTGRSASITFRWYPLADVIQYELWIAFDKEFSIVLRQEIVDPADVFAPVWILPEGTFLVGKTYYWKVRANRTITGEIIRSPWSATMFFTVKVGAPIRAPYAGPFLLSPANRATGISRSPAFSWAPVPQAAEYEFVLAKDAAMTQIIVKDKVFTTAYKYDGELDWGTTYFWQVRVTKPFPGLSSSVSSFTVVEKGAETGVTEVPTPTPMPLWAWVLIGVLTVLLLIVVAMNFFGANLELIFRKIANTFRGRRW